MRWNCINMFLRRWVEKIRMIKSIWNGRFHICCKLADNYFCRSFGPGGWKSIWPVDIPRCCGISRTWSRAYRKHCVQWVPLVWSNACFKHLTHLTWKSFSSIESPLDWSHKSGWRTTERRSKSYRIDPNTTHHILYRMENFVKFCASHSLLSARRLLYAW